MAQPLNAALKFMQSLAPSTPLPIALNRDFKLPDDGWIQLAKYGEVRAPLAAPGQKPVEVIQQIDEPAIDGIIGKFREAKAQPNFSGLLVDFEHFSTDPTKESRAGAWIEDLQKRADGLYGLPRLSNSGRSAIEGGDYRFISPVFAYPPRSYNAGEKVRPQAILSAGLTNDPRIKGMLPLSNRNGESADAGNNQPVPNMKNLNKELGLAEDAPEASALAAIQQIKNRASSAETERDALKTERDTLLSSQVEADLNSHGIKGEAREKWKGALIANRAQALDLLASLAKPESGYAVTHNRGAAKTPVTGPQSAPATKAQRDAAINEYRTANRCDFETAWSALRKTKPELFLES